MDIRIRANNAIYAERLGSIKPDGGTIAWESGDDTVAAVNTAYQWIYTPAAGDQDNYTTLTGSITPYSVSSIKYLDWNDTNKVLEEKTCEDPMPITNSTTTLGESGKTTWYYVKDSVTIDSAVTVNGDAHLILCDGKTLTTGAVEINDSLTVYGQSGQSGKFEATDGTAAKGDSCGIYVTSSAKLTVNGGKLKATGGAATGNGGKSYGILAMGEIQF